MPELLEEERPVDAEFHPLTDLSDHFDVTRQQVYAEAKRGHIGGTVRVGRLWKITAAALEYHKLHGYGRDVPNWSPELNP